MVDNKTRILGVVILCVFAVLESLAQQGVLSEELTSLVKEIAIVALPLLGLGAIADVLNVERRRRNPSVSALKDDERATIETNNESRGAK